ncbi:hypothetical protein EK21DRAFT_90004 [Setomelanomma holmii]|uniref:Uncharacterized protein n=1 Tax=Setomelanomma holmii TaxID=210430 RepID=A0A9P4LKZ6_9PLEO|nr:hypothetical protein EK21DRAFT_90004 [Setomelanomma holmii]
METITNAASAAATTVSSLIYGQPAKDSEATNATTGNETAGKEPLSGEQGKGTVNEPFDKGNTEPADTTSKTTGNTSYTADDFLPLNPTLGQPSTTESFSNTKSGSSSATGMPIIPLNPDVATMGGGKTDTLASAETGATETTGITDKVYKETPLDDIKLSGAPGAGPAAPEYTPATPETNVTSTTTDKPTESSSDKPVEHETAKNSTTSSAPKESSSAKKEGVDTEIDAILNKTPKAEHSVDDRETESPHAKMTGKTVRHTEASKSGEGGEPASLAAADTGRKSESSKSTDATSPSGVDEKTDKKKKMSALTGKLKDKLHIGSKDK